MRYYSQGGIIFIVKRLVDTNVLLDFPNILQEPEVVVHYSSIEELDKLKIATGERGMLARKAIHSLEDNAGNYEICNIEVLGKEVDDVLLFIAEKFKYILITNDTNLRVKCLAKGVECSGYQTETIDYTDIYKIECKLSEEELANFYEGYWDDSIVEENQYLLLLNKQNQVIDKYVKRQGRLERVLFQTINSDYLGTIKPRNLEQQLAIDLLHNRVAKVKLIRGVYGSGKDYLMLSQALQYVQDGVFKKIIFIRPNIGVKNIPEIGFLPGSAFDKLSWTLGPFYDKIGGVEGVKQLIAREQLELVPLSFIRGRSFEDSIVYVCEGQNATTEIAKLILGRIGEGSELWWNSDNHQTDRRIFDEDNGVFKMLEKLHGNPLFGYVYLPKTERGDVANLANLLDN